MGGGQRSGQGGPRGVLGARGRNKSSADLWAAFQRIAGCRENKLCIRRGWKLRGGRLPRMNPSTSTSQADKGRVLCAEVLTVAQGKSPDRGGDGNTCPLTEKPEINRTGQHKIVVDLNKRLFRFPLLFNFFPLFTVGFARVPGGAGTLSSCASDQKVSSAQGAVGRALHSAARSVHRDAPIRLHVSSRLPRTKGQGFSSEKIQKIFI